MMRSQPLSWTDCNQGGRGLLQRRGGVRKHARSGIARIQISERRKREEKIFFLRIKARAATCCSSLSPVFFFCGWQAGQSGGNAILSLKRLSIL